MSGRRLPAVRLPTVVAGQGVDEESLGESTVRVELPPSSKFGFAWPTDPPPPVPIVPSTERPAGVTLSSSEGETDVSEEELNHPVRRDPRAGEGEDSEFVTPTNNLDSDQNPLDRPEQLPKLSRAFSMPLPSQLGPLRNPRRLSSSVNDNSPTVIELSPEFGPFHELSLELADSVQMVIQTLLQLSPPQVLDPAKEQFSACSLSIPTPSISAMFTSMKNLNYMSANMSALSLDAQVHQVTGSSKSPSSPAILSDFDVGEMLQSVGDALSGLAAQVGVDLVLFHGDLGMKHVAVKGDESGISYTLSHVIRQIVGIAHPGDTIEIGLFVEDVQAPKEQTDDSDTPRMDSTGRGSPAHDHDGPVQCTFHILHRSAPSSHAEWSEGISGGDIPQSPESPSFRSQPFFRTLFLRRLLRHVGASFQEDVQPRGLSAGRSCELVVTLDRGLPSVVDPTVTDRSDETAYQGYPELKISNEPTLDELTRFAESIKGRKATLFANSKGSFAQHLTSYLTAWGLDVSHVSTEPDAYTLSEHVDRIPETVPGTGAGREELVPPAHQEHASGAPPPAAGAHGGSDALSFCLIDDDVAVLRSRLQKMKADLAYPLHLNTRKRPSLASNHRPRSSPQVARVMGLTPSSAAPSTPPPVVIHFTSLANFKLVKDVVQSILIPGPGNPSRVPEVIVIPKPAGPRRVLTALHTAITKPIVDPFFSPTATSPISPGFPSSTPFFHMSGPAKSPGARSTTSIRTASDKSARSPKEYPPSSPRGVSDSMEYFSDAAARLGASPASGLVIQSPDGQPAGIFFHPKPKGSRSEKTTPQSERGGGQFDHPARSRGVSFRRTSDTDPKSGGLGVGPVDTARRSPRPSVGGNADIVSESPTGEGPHVKGKSRAATHEHAVPSFPGESPISAGLVPSPSVEKSASPGPSRAGSRRSVHSDSRHPSDPPTSPSRPTPGSARKPRRPNLDLSVSAPSALQKKGKWSDNNIVPPISVLIVDDNPINQTILSTFMTKRKIKYDVAQNGEEAVSKWRTGGFHLILMDIQMPVMDGIEATKEIRRVEKANVMGGFPPTPQSEGQRTPSEASTTSESRSTMSTPPYRSSVIIVALTASSLQSDRVAALAAGCNDFLTKPVSLHWLNSKIIEWGSIKALQMWADIRPEAAKSISTGQAVQAQHVARRLHVPEGRSTPARSRSRSSSVTRKAKMGDSTTPVAKTLLGSDKTVTLNSLLHDDSPGAFSNSSSDSANVPAAPSPLAVAERVMNSAEPAEGTSSVQDSPTAVIDNAAETLPPAAGSFFPSTRSSDHVASPENLTSTLPDPSERSATPSLPEISDPKAAAADESPTTSQDAQPPPPPPEPQ